MNYFKNFFLVIAAISIIQPSTLLATSNNNISSDLESEVLQQFDDICGDTWCEGEYDYRFEKFSCNFNIKTCTLNYHILGHKKQLPFQCSFTGINHTQNFILDNWMSIYEQMNLCNSDNEEIMNSMDI